MAKRAAAKTEDDVRPVDRMREDEPAGYTREELLAELERRDREERDLPQRPIRDPEWADRELRADPTGCLVVIVIALLMLVIGWMAYRELGGGSQPAPPPGPAPAPQVDLRSYTQPIAAKLAYDPAKAERVRDVYAGFRDALAGPSGKRMTDSRVLKQVQSAMLTDLDTKGGQSVGAEIDQAIGGYLGITKNTDKEGGWEPKAFDDDDRRKLVEIVGAISQAGAEAR